MEEHRKQCEKSDDDRVKKTILDMDFNDNDPDKRGYNGPTLAEVLIDQHEREQSEALEKGESQENTEDWQNDDFWILFPENKKDDDEKK